MLFNRARALGLMEQHGLDALVATSRHNVFYLGGLDGWAQATYGDAATETFAVFFRREDRPPALIVSRQDETYYAAEGSWIADVRGYGAPSAMEVPPGARAETPEEERLLRLLPGGGAPREGSSAAALLRLLKDRGLAQGRAALDEEGVKPATRAKLAASLPGVEWLEGQRSIGARFPPPHDGTHHLVHSCVPPLDARCFPILDPELIEYFRAPRFDYVHPSCSHLESLHVPAWFHSQYPNQKSWKESPVVARTRCPS